MKQTSEEFRGKLGLAITWIGILGLPLGVGVVLGYYAGDRGVLWLPTMLHILLVITIGSVLAIIGGRAVLRGASHDVVALRGLCGPVLYLSAQAAAPLPSAKRPYAQGRDRPANRWVKSHPTVDAARPGLR